MNKKICFLILVISFSASLNAQSFKDILPEKNITINWLLISGGVSYERKINKRVTWISSLGVSGSFKAGSNSYLGTGSYSEFSFKPSIGTAARYYISTNNTNKKNQINKVFAGTYFDIGTSVSGKAFGNPLYHDPRGTYGIGVGIGRQIQKLSGWNFAYDIGYTLFSGVFEANSNNNGSGFGINLSIGYSLNL